MKLQKGHKVLINNVWTKKQELTYIKLLGSNPQFVYVRVYNGAGDKHKCNVSNIIKNFGHTSTEEILDKHPEYFI